MPMASLVAAINKTAVTMHHAVEMVNRLTHELAKTDPKLRKRLRYYRRYERVGRARRK